MMHNDETRTHLETILAEVVAFADTLNVSGVELLENDDYVAVVDDILRPHTTPELDVEDLITELLDLAGDADDDMYND